MPYTLEQYLKQLVFRLCENKGLQTVDIFSFNDFLVNIYPFKYFLTDKSVNQYFSYLYVAFFDSHSYKGM